MTEAGVVNNNAKPSPFPCQQKNTLGVYSSQQKSTQTHEKYTKITASTHLGWNNQKLKFTNQI
jgi:hypothetical protein